MNIMEYRGDLLDAEVDVIAHQCNCKTHRAAGLAAQIFKRFPRTNDYVSNPDDSRYGTYLLHYVEGAKFRAVLNLFTQLYPGSPQDIGPLDTEQDRLRKFGSTLNGFCLEYGGVFESIAFPMGIGCGLAGGDWPSYKRVIFDLAAQYPEMEFRIVEKV